MKLYQFKQFVNNFVIFKLFAVLFILTSVNPWLLLFIVVGVYYLIQKFWFSSQGSSSAVYETLSKGHMFYSGTL